VNSQANLERYDSVKDTHNHTDRQTDRQTGKQTDKQTDTDNQCFLIKCSLLAAV